MRYLCALALCLIAAFAVVFWLLLQPSASLVETPSSPSPPVPAGESIARGKAAGAAVAAAPTGQAPEPVVSAPAPAVATAHVVPVTQASPDIAARARQRTIDRIRAFEAGQGWLELFERYAATAGQGVDAEEKYLVARALEVCEGPRKVNRNLADERKNFATRLAANDPDYDKRLRLYEQLQSYPCARFREVEYARQDYERLLREAADSGDPKARVLLIEKAVKNKNNFSSADLDNLQRGDLQAALSSGDPAAIRRAGDLLSRSANGAPITVGPEGAPANAYLLQQAWRLVACDYGLPCDKDSQSVRAACAYSGHCAAENHESLLAMYQLGALQFQQVQQYRSLISQALAAKRWDWIGLSRKG
jgi:hypothetical protein